MLSFSRQIRLKSHARETNLDKSGTRIALANVIWLAPHLTNVLVCNANANATLVSKSLSACPQRVFLAQEKRSLISVSLIPAKGWTAATDMTMNTTFMTSRGKMAILSLRTFIVPTRISTKTHTGTIWRN